ncbi:MAG: family 1 glycosylhydrolase [Acidimicrobiia bacterium]
MGFPDDFWWGTASSSTQSEGAAPASDWLALEEAGLVPRSGDGNGFATRFADDFALMVRHGLTHHRLSIEWARIEPVEGQRDQAAVEHYREMLETACAAGIAPWVCLHHFTLPGWFTEVGEGGFVDDHARSYFWARHVAFCAETFGDLVFGWKPINEPMAYAAVYAEGGRPKHTIDWGRAFERYGATLLAQRDAWRELRGGTGPVATIHNLVPLFTLDDDPETRRWFDVADEITWRIWIRADRDGVLALPGQAEREVPDLRECCDLVGFSYYCAAVIGADGESSPYPSDARVGPMGYAPWSEGLGIVLRRLQDELPDRPRLICEHGVGTDDDEWRVDVLRESLGVVEEAIADGVDVRGFFHWTGVDNYEWDRGFEVPFGLFDRNREPRASAALLAARARGR